MQARQSSFLDEVPDAMVEQTERRLADRARVLERAGQVDPGRADPGDQLAGGGVEHVHRAVVALRRPPLSADVAGQRHGFPPGVEPAGGT